MRGALIIFDNPAALRAAAMVGRSASAWFSSPEHFQSKIFSSLELASCRKTLQDASGHWSFVIPAQARIHKTTENSGICCYIWMRDFASMTTMGGSPQSSGNLLEQIFRSFGIASYFPPSRKGFKTMMPCPGIYLSCPPSKAPVAFRALLWHLSRAFSPDAE